MIFLTSFSSHSVFRMLVFPLGLKRKVNYPPWGMHLAENTAESFSSLSLMVARLISRNVQCSELIWDSCTHSSSSMECVKENVTVSHDFLILTDAKHRTTEKRETLLFLLLVSSLSSASFLRLHKKLANKEEDRGEEKKTDFFHLIFCLNNTADRCCCVSGRTFDFGCCVLAHVEKSWASAAATANNRPTNDEKSLWRKKKVKQQKKKQAKESERCKPQKIIFCKWWWASRRNIFLTYKIYMLQSFLLSLEAFSAIRDFMFYSRWLKLETVELCMQCAELKNSICARWTTSLT